MHAEDFILIFPHMKHCDLLDGSVRCVLTLVREHNLNRILDNLECKELTSEFSIQPNS